ncbi:hypothetical protein CROQUDRAFT_431614 [Cronartium quercuum f. sp. fusiforme G11]|uniref:Uncharacterized protein n=1 Tax=Cronartium quercuum f. sp. fusiforme G11 TaxID=708437 RepID=A0A9P6NMA2_9BASI|nr:hypothetical protein CROQUDRAFT_431614 [Cronartium quercuum f. sp. fusiforme G11]
MYFFFLYIYMYFFGRSLSSQSVFYEFVLNQSFLSFFYLGTIVYDLFIRSDSHFLLYFNSISFILGLSSINFCG